MVTLCIDNSFKRQAEAHLERAGPDFDGPREVPPGVRRHQLLQGDGAREAIRPGGGRALQAGEMMYPLIII